MAEASADIRKAAKLHLVSVLIGAIISVGPASLMLYLENRARAREATLTRRLGALREFARACNEFQTESDYYLLLGSQPVVPKDENLRELTASLRRLNDKQAAILTAMSMAVAMFDSEVPSPLPLPEQVPQASPSPPDEARTALRIERLRVRCENQEIEMIKRLRDY